MPTIKATWIGKEQFQRRMRALEPAIQKYVHPALAKSGDELVAMQKRLVPLGTGEHELRDSIRWDWDPESGLRILNRAGDEAAYYAPFVEYGTVNTPAQPFFRPAYFTLKQKISRRIKGAVRKAVKTG